MAQLSSSVPSIRNTAAIALAAVVFIESWFLYFYNWEGSFAGLSDDHYFYLVRGWQILHGDLPVRDFVDHGAPLFYYVGAAVQMLFGRGTLSEVAFTTTMLSLSAAGTFLLASRASGSLLAGLAGALFQILLSPRFYNYPKLLVYVVAIPLIWHYASKPGMTRLVWVAIVTAVGFLFRHDHGAFIGVALAALIAVLPGLTWRSRARHVAAYGLMCLALLSPYLLFIQMNGGVARYFRDAVEWAERDRDRTPLVWPGLFERTAADGNVLERGIAVLRDNAVAWQFYLELALPLLALALLAMSPTAFRPGWPRARAKLLSVAVLGVVLNAGFLRSPLDARLADPSVPLAILLAWMVASAVRTFTTESTLAIALQPHARAVRGATALVAAAIVGVAAVTLTADDVFSRVRGAEIGANVPRMVERAAASAEQLRELWKLETWVHRRDRSDFMTLALYVNACTKPADRVLIQAYLPQVFGVSRRAFAGGHADLRPGFFGSEEAQRLTVERLRQQSVPLVLLEGDAQDEGFRKGFPLVMAYLDHHYEVVGSREFDDRMTLTLLVERWRRPLGTYEPLGWPCFGPGRVRSEEKLSSAHSGVVEPDAPVMNAGMSSRGVQS